MRQPNETNDIAVVVVAVIVRRCRLADDFTKLAQQHFRGGAERVSEVEKPRESETFVTLHCYYWRPRHLMSHQKSVRHLSDHPVALRALAR